MVARSDVSVAGGTASGSGGVAGVAGGAASGSGGRASVSDCLAGCVQ